MCSCCYNSYFFKSRYDSTFVYGSNISCLSKQLKLQLKETYNTMIILVVPYYLLVMALSLDYGVGEYINLLLLSFFICYIIL